VVLQILLRQEKQVEEGNDAEVTTGVAGMDEGCLLFLFDCPE
jgi:hypothetical protein